MWLIARRTQSVGVPSTANRRSPIWRIRNGRCSVSEWLAPDCSVSGATPQTSSDRVRAIFSSTSRPGAWIPSSFDSRIRAFDKSRGALSIRGNPIETTHVRPQDLRHDYGSVRLLKIFHHRNQAPSDGNTGAVERMDELGVLFATRPATCFHAARLKVTAVGDAGNLPVHVLTRQPDLDIVGLPRRETHVAGAEHDGAKRQAQPLQHRFGAFGHPLMLGL